MNRLPLTLSENARRVLEARYFRRDAAGRVCERAEELFARVARAVAAAEATWAGPAETALWEERFYELMATLRFLPNSPTLMNAGTPCPQLSACFVLPVGDTIEEIFDALKQMALIQRSGGGTGFSFSRLRPKGDRVTSTGGTSSGPVSFMRIFDGATENIKQGGKRRGANMGILRVDHPDVMEFVAAKADGQGLRNFNLSVAVTDSFMTAARAGQSYALIHPGTGREVGRRDARQTFRAIAEAAWKCGDPGLVFLDAINRANPLPSLGDMEATNPCGEVPLLAYESCNLGSINLARLLTGNPAGWTIDWTKLKETVQQAVRFLDDVIEVNQYPLPQIEKITRANRKIGLGVMGFAEMLIRLGVPYDSEQSVELADRLMRVVADEALAASATLAAQRGGFPNWPRSVYRQRAQPVRHATRTAIAPTGTISMIAGTSPSIEPLFALAYRHHVLDGQTLAEVNPLLQEELHRLDPHAQRGLQEMAQGRSLRSLPGIPETLKRLFVTALEISPDWHLRLQATFQQHVDNSVSKTVNLPQETGPAEVSRAYEHAWESGLKGVTIYRYGSQAAQVLELGAEESAWPLDHGSQCDPEECRL